MKPRVFIVDDDRDQLALLTAQLERGGGFRTEAFQRPREALQAILTDVPDAVVTDWMMPNLSGLDLLREIRASYPALPVIVLTGDEDPETASEAMAAGATDFSTKPTSPAALVARIEHALDEVPAREAILETARSRFDPHGIIGSHPRIVEVRQFVQNVASVARVPALLLGESGTGKNLVARAIHSASKGSDFRFVEVNCAALPGHLLEAELFGYEKGAFTDARQAKKGLVEIADGGTLFLDELGSMPLELQAKLLTFLESRLFRRLGSTRDQSVELRIVAATNADLEEEARTGRFREDLYYRLNVARFELPPLRAIRSDLPELTRHFVERAASYFGKPVPQVDGTSLAGLLQYDWPGNVRELRNVVERALIFHRGGPLRIDRPGVEGRPSTGPAQPAARGEAVDGTPGSGTDGPMEGESPPPESPFGAGAVHLPHGLTLEEVERLYIESTMERLDNRVADAAESLGVSRKVLWMRRKRYGLLEE